MIRAPGKDLGRMSTPQSGIFALGTASHAYLEFDASGAGREHEFVAAISFLREPRTTMGGVNLVTGFRPELWRAVAPADMPAELEGFGADLVAADGFVMPTTQHDAVLWLSGSAYDVVFDVARDAIGELRDLASVAEETSSWPYRHDRDLTASSTQARIRHSSTPRTSPSSRTGDPEPAARSSSCRSGPMTRRPGSRSPRPSRSA
jgi:deferrochelatase/peroxidase EfeB